MNKRVFIKIAKNILDSKSYSGLKKVKDDHDFHNAFKSLMLSKLEEECYSMYNKLSNLKLLKKDYFFAEIYFKLLDIKFSELRSNFSMNNLNRTIYLLSKVKNEVNLNV